MVDRFELWHALMGLLLVVWVAKDPLLGGDTRRADWLCLLAGTLLPLLDYVVPLLTTMDHIALLVRDQPLHSLLNGMALVLGLALVAGLTVGPQRVLRGAAWATAGYGLHLWLDWSGGETIWLGIPDAGRGSSWNGYYPGHVVLVAWLALGLAVRKLWPRRLGLVRWVTLTGVGVYLLGGPLQYALVRLQVTERPIGPGLLTVAPANPWHTRWSAVGQEKAGYWVMMLDGAGNPLTTPERIDFADDPPALLSHMRDEILRRLVLTHFRHPVALVAQTSTGATVVIQEAVDRHARREGPTLTLVTSIDDRERSYELERFD